MLSKCCSASRRQHTPIPLFIPNVLCYIRILLSFASLYTAFLINVAERPFFNLLRTASLWALAALLDHIDGKTARYLNQCSELGVLFDIIADNILRSCSWMSCIMAIQSQPQTSKVTLLILPLVTVGLTSMEWITMFSTQMLALRRNKSHWKEIPQSEDSIPGNDKGTAGTKSSAPWLIDRMFRNNFCNVLGIVTIYGSMGAGMLQFLYIQQDIMVKR